MVRLMVDKGCLCFVVIEKSYDALKWQRGDGFCRENSPPEELQRDR